MMMVRPLDGEAVEVPSIRGRYTGHLPEPTVRELQRKVCYRLAAEGYDDRAIGQVVNLAAPVVARLLAEPDPIEDPTLPSDEPPGIGPPVPRSSGTFVDVSAKFVARLERDYSPEGDDARCRAVGRLEDVRSWLASIKPRKAGRRAGG